MTKDLTRGNPLKLILLFTIPALIGNVFQQLYSMVDSVIVGRFVSLEGLAAVGASGPVTFMVIMSVIGLTNGFAVITAQRFGAGDAKGVRSSVVTSLILCGIMTVIITGIGLFTVTPLLKVMNTPEEIFHDAWLYSVIIYCGFIATIYYNMMSSIIRALGDSKTPLYFLIFSSVLNVIVDLILILVFHMGVAGAAYATVFAQLISAIVCTIYAFKNYEIIKLTKEDMVFDWSLAWEHLKIGFPMAMQGVITGVGIIVFQAVLNGFGAAAIAAYTAASKVEILITQAVASLGLTMSTYCGQNYGAGRMDRIRQGIRCSVWMGVVASLLIGALMIFGGRASTMLFLSEPTEEVLEYAATYLRTIGFFQIPLTILFIFRNSLQGLGDGMTPLMGGIGELVARILIVLTLPATMGYLGICFASPMAWIFADIPLVGKYIWMMRKYKKKERWEAKA
ncbi:MAG: MATE family efflux transporter [Lachnospiraceae bacterium]|nr:MATE family efflux transporter [Lachnospiraceae bacterium]